MIAQEKWINIWKALNFCVKWWVIQLSQLLSDFRVYTQDFCTWDPNDRTVKVDTYLKSPNFLRWIVSIIILSASFSFLSVYSGFGLQTECINCMKMVATYLKRSALSASNTVHCDSLFDCKKEKNWQLGCHGCAIDNCYAFIRIILPKLHSNTSSSLYLIHFNVNTSKFYGRLESSGASATWSSLSRNSFRRSRSDPGSCTSCKSWSSRCMDLSSTSTVV